MPRGLGLAAVTDVDRLQKFESTTVTPRNLRPTSESAAVPCVDRPPKNESTSVTPGWQAVGDALERHAARKAAVIAVHPEHAALFGMLGRPDKRAMLADMARHHCAFCGKCGQAIAPGDAVWITRKWFAGDFGDDVVATPLCTACAEMGDDSWGPRVPIHQYEYGRARPCEGCGRPVAWETRIKPRRRNICSDHCGWTVANRRRSARSAVLRRKVCATCGVGFTGGRRDAVTCSSACRQKSYRQRSARHDSAPAPLPVSIGDEGAISDADNDTR